MTTKCMHNPGLHTGKMEKYVAIREIIGIADKIWI